MRNLSVKAILWGLALLAGGTLLHSDSRMNPEQEGWLKLKQFSFNEAHEFFHNESRLKNRNKRYPALRLGEAIALLNVEPSTQENARESARIITEILAEDPVDDITAAGQYLHARIRQRHAANSKDTHEQSIRQAYRQVATQWPDHPIGQLAASKWLLHVLYEGADATPTARLREAEKLGRYFHLEEFQALYHMTMGRSYLFFQIEIEKALPHYTKALLLGVLNPTIRADTLVATGQLAEMAGDIEAAAHWHTRFLEENPRDDRAYTVSQRLRKLSDDIQQSQ